MSNDNKKKRSVLRRLASLLGCISLLAGLITFAIAGIVIHAVIAIIVGLGAIAVPAVASGGGIIDIFVDAIEGVAEGFTMIAEGIGELFGSL